MIYVTKIVYSIFSQVRMIGFVIWPIMLSMKKVTKSDKANHTCEIVLSLSTVVLNSRDW